MERTRYARLITMRAKRGKGSRFVKTFEKAVASPAMELEGLRRLYLLRPVGKNDAFVAISLWENQRSAERYAKSARNKEYSAKLAGLQKGGARVRKFRVEVHAVGKSAQRD